MVIRKLVKITSVTVGLCMLVLSFSACKPQEKGSSTQNSTKAVVQDSASSAANTSGEETDPFGKYSPAIEVTAARYNNSNFKFIPGDPEKDSLEKNVWITAYEEQLGIQVKYLWIPPVDQYEQKWNVSIASNDIPDVAAVNAKIFNMLASNGMLEDVADVFDKYASQDYKEYNKMDDGLTKQFCTFDGKLMALPMTGSQPDNTPLLFLRMDWLKKVGLPEPGNMEELLQIAEAFVKEDPDGNSKNDTYGLVLNKDVVTGFCDLGGFFNGYHAYWNIWLDDGAGNLVYSTIQPEMKTALQKLQDMYKAGLLDKEFAVKDPWKAGEAVAAGKVGIAYGVNWAPLVSFTDNIQADPKAEWKAFPVLSIDGNPAKPQASFTPTEYFVVKKGFKNPEAAVKILNLNIKLSTDYELAGKYLSDDKVSEIGNYKLGHFLSRPWDNLTTHLSVADIFTSGDESGLTTANAKTKRTYEAIKAAVQGDRKQFANNLVFGIGGTFSIINQYKNSNQIQVDLLKTFPTPTMAEKGANLDMKIKEAFLKIIMGAPIDEFDKVVSEWRSMGGDDVIKEANAWYKASKDK